MKYHLIPAVLVLGIVTGPTVAQTANSSPTAGSAGAGGNVSRTAPSGGTAKPDPGVPQVGPETPVEKNAEVQSQKDTSICKGC